MTPLETAGKETQMGWTSAKTWTVGEVLTAADMNTYVRGQHGAPE